MSEISVRLPVFEENDLRQNIQIPYLSKHTDDSGFQLVRCWYVFRHRISLFSTILDKLKEYAPYRCCLVS